MLTRLDDLLDERSASTEDISLAFCRPVPAVNVERRSCYWPVVPI